LPLRNGLCWEKGNSLSNNLTFKNILPIFLANFSFAVMTQADMVMVKHSFSAQEAGIYASASIIGKAVMYLPGAVVLAMFPMVAQSNALRFNSHHLLKRAITICLCLSGAGALLLFTFPELIIIFFFANKYMEATEAVRIFGIAMLPMAMLLILMNYFMARGMSIFSYILILGALVETILILFFHSSLITVIYILLSVGVIFSSMGFILIYFENGVERAKIPLMVKQDVSIKDGE
jgi:O-antigen/teichoic acid export membrane protein